MDVTGREVVWQLFAVMALVFANGFFVAAEFSIVTVRKTRVDQLVAEGHSNKEVAEVLGVSPATVETHRAHILQKLDVHNTAELVLYAVRRGVIS
jgi:DNA-binding NarL/FixJ family response regulator